nr:vegetative cell wall protein gp1-like [Aegilops tauschii subsp. strangulata]
MQTCPRGPPAINAAAPQSTGMRAIRAASHPSRIHPPRPPPHASPHPSQPHPPHPPHQSRRPRCACTQAVSRACPGVPPAISPPPHRCRLPPLSAPRLPSDRCRLPLHLPDATAAACRRCRLLVYPTPPLPPPRLPADSPAAWHAPSRRVVRGGRGSKRLHACRAVINMPTLIAPASRPPPPLPRIAPPAARRFIKAQLVPPTPTPSFPRPHPHPSHRRPPSMAFFRGSSSTVGGDDDDDKPGAWPTSIGVS